MFDIDGLEIRHRINPRMKHAYLHVETDGSIVLKSNGRDAAGLRAFVVSKRSWIERQLLKVRQRPTMTLGTDILYKGELLALDAIGNAPAASGSEAVLRKGYDRFYKERAAHCLNEKTAYFAEVMGIAYDSVRLRKMKRRWGSCSKTGVITYNTLLMQLPEALIDYTVVHELAHRIHFNHSADFHALVASYIGNERELRRFMKGHSVCSY